MNFLKRSISEAEREEYFNNGFVVVRQIISPRWFKKFSVELENELSRVETSATALNLTELSLFLETQKLRKGYELNSDGKGNRGRFITETEIWTRNDLFRKIALRTNLPEAASDILNRDKVFLYDDQIFLKEPNCENMTMYHQDLPYLHMTGGDLCTIWIPIDPVTPDTGGLRYVTGSHKWQETYKVGFFVNEDAKPGAVGEVMPPFLHIDQRDDVVSPRMFLGDIIIHDCKTIHGSTGNQSSSLMRRAWSVRYAGKNARYFHKIAAPQKVHQTRSLRNFQPFCDPEFPQAWPQN